MDYKGSIAIKAPLERVMRALTDEKELVRYFPTTAKTDPRKGGRYKYTWEFEKSSRMGGKIFTNEGEYLEFSPDKVAYTWWSGKDFSASGSKEENYKTRVEFSLREKDGSTEVRLFHSGFKTEAEYKDHKEGWDSVLQSLKTYLEGGADKRKEYGQIVK